MTGKRVVKITMPEDLYLELVRRYGVRRLSQAVVQMLSAALGLGEAGARATGSGSEAPSTAPRRVKCPKCGHEWETRSRLVLVTCPSCYNKVRVDARAAGSTEALKTLKR